MGSVLSVLTKSMSQTQKAVAVVAVASWLLAYWSTRKPKPTHAFTRAVRLVNFLGNACYNLLGQHLINPKWSDMKKLVEKGNYPFWGTGEETARGVQLLCEEFENSPGNGRASKTFHGGVMPSSRLLVRELLKNNLQHRADVGKWISDHPSILKIGVKKPIIITGMYRSGTTLLMRLMSQDPKCRKIKLWEMLCAPPPAVSEQHDTDPRIDAKDKEFGTYDMVQPGFLKRFFSSHPMNIREQDEELMLMADCAKAVFWGAQMCKEESPFWTWVHSEGNNNEVYQYIYRYFQYLSSSFPPDTDGGFFILKTPMHIYYQDAMFQQFPDARFVYCHRDPNNTVGSTMRMFTTMTELFMNRNDTAFDDRLRCQQWLRMCCDMHRRMVDFKKRGVIPDKQRFDVRYPELVKDPVQMVKRIYDHFGEPVSAEHEANMRDFLANNPQGKHGRAAYKMEDFFSSQEQLYANKHIAEFRDVFDV